ncbi:MAG: IclR family transcriptional regulator [Alphaproteobacteria bacterium]|nr:IclR family transcriptional regulator [Alphaproteobacteria bacterium]
MNVVKSSKLPVNPASVNRDKDRLSDAPHGSSKSILRAMNLLRQVGLSQNIGLTNLAKLTGLSKPTVHRILLALIKTGLVKQNSNDKQYSLGLDAYLLGQLAEPPHNIHNLARDGMSRLADISGDIAFLSIVQGTSTVCLHREEGKYPIRTHVLNVGDRHPMPMGAASLAILSCLPEADVNVILKINSAEVMSKFPDFDMERIRRLVVNARQQGWALNPGLVFPGSWAISAPVRDPDGRVLGAVTIAAIESRLKGERQCVLAIPLMKEAQKLEKLIRNAHLAIRPSGSLLG